MTAPLDHDPYRYRTETLLADGEADALLWVASFGPEPLPSTLADDVPVIVLGHPALAALTGKRNAPTVFIPVATPGIDSGGHLFRIDATVVAPLQAARKTPAADRRRDRRRTRQGEPAMSLARLKGGVVYDPANGVNGERRDIYFRDGRIVDNAENAPVDDDYDASGMVVMAGGIDLHSHIGGGKTNLSRLLLPEDHRANADAAASVRRATICACRPAASARPARLPPATATRRWDTRQPSSRR